MNERITNYIEDKEMKIFIQQRLDKLYYEAESHKTSDAYRIAREIEKIKNEFPNLRDVLENDKVMILSEVEVRAMVKFHELQMKQFNEMENIAYYTGVKDTFQLLKKVDVV